MSQLETNTASLQAILDTVNALPEAGSSGGTSIETATITVGTDYLSINSATTYSDGAFGAFYSNTITESLEHVVVGSCIVISNNTIGGTIECTNCTLVYDASSEIAVQINAGATSASVYVQSDEPT